MLKKIEEEEPETQEQAALAEEGVHLGAWKAVDAYSQTVEWPSFETQVGNLLHAIPLLIGDVRCRIDVNMMAGGNPDLVARYLALLWIFQQQRKKLLQGIFSSTFSLLPGVFPWVAVVVGRSAWKLSLRAAGVTIV